MLSEGPTSEARAASLESTLLIASGEDNGFGNSVKAARTSLLDLIPPGVPHHRCAFASIRRESKVIIFGYRRFKNWLHPCNAAPEAGIRAPGVSGFQSTRPRPTLRTAPTQAPLQARFTDATGFDDPTACHSFLSAFALTPPALDHAPVPPIAAASLCRLAICTWVSPPFTYSHCWR